MKYAPVIVFGYKREDKIRICLEALEKNKEAKESDLIIFSDGAKGEVDQKEVDNVREWIEAYAKKTIFKTVTIYKQEKNIGLANSIINGVTKVIENYGKAIIVEDDLKTSSDFLSYMNEALIFYENNKRIGSISAYTCPIKELDTYNKDIYILRKGECWGWGTWSDRWKGVDWKIEDFDNYLKNRKKRLQFEKLQMGLDDMLCRQMRGELDSWAVRWCYHLFSENLLTVYPRMSKTENIGLDNSGTHCIKTNLYEKRIYAGNGRYHFENLSLDLALEKKVAEFSKLSIQTRISNWIKICCYR